MQLPSRARASLTTVAASSIASLLAGVGLAAAQPGPAPAPGAQPAAPAKAPGRPAPAAPAPAKLDADARFDVQEVVRGLEVPWDMAWDHTGRMLVTERPGRVRAVVEGKLLDKPLYTVPNIKAGRGEIGLMGICLHPDFKTNGYLYIAHGYRAADGSGEDVRVVRLVEKDGQVTLDKVIMQTPPAGPNHAGCAVRFGPDKKLYITTGEGFKGQLAQDMTSLAGKTLRLNDDGTVPADNPFTGPEHKAKGVRPEIYSFGNRNGQGLDWQPGSNLLWEAEHGPSGENGWSGHDEVNIIRPGADYGWPTIYGAQKADGKQTPVHFWERAVAPVALCFYTGDKLPAFKGSMFVAALGGLRRDAEPGLFRFVIEGERIKSVERIVTDFGRVRGVANGPDGHLYFSTSNRDGRGRAREGDDKIYRLVPKPATN